MVPGVQVHAKTSIRVNTVIKKYPITYLEKMARERYTIMYYLSVEATFLLGLISSMPKSVATKSLIGCIKVTLLSI